LRSGISDSPPPSTVLPPSPIENPLYVPSHQDLVMVDLPDNFMNPLKLFWPYQTTSWNRHDEDLEGIRREWWTADRLQPIKWEIGRKNLNKSFWKRRVLYKIFWQAISPVSVAPVNFVVRVRRKHTP
jgi:hypothetical protein